MQNKLIEGISHIKNSNYRKIILEALFTKELLTPKDISKIVSLRLNHVSMTLGELKNLELVECVNETSKRGRLYKITDLGKRAITWIKEN